MLGVFAVIDSWRRVDTHLYMVVTSRPTKSLLLRDSSSDSPLLRGAVIMKELPAKKVFSTAVLAACLTLLSTSEIALAEIDDSDSRQTNVLLRTAYFQMLKGEFQLAAANHKLAVIADRDSVAARRHLGYSLLKLGHYKEALEQLHYLVVMTEPTTFDMCLYGEACLQSGQYALAESWFAEALKSDSELENARIGLGKAVAAAKKKDHTVSGEQKFLVDESHQDFSREPSVDQALPSLVAAGGAQSQPKISFTAAPAKNKTLGNNQVHNAWESYKGLQSK